MQIVLNGNEREISAGLTAAGLVDELGLSEQRIAVEVNEELIVRSALAQHVLTAGDRIEIIQAIGGG